MGKMAVLLVNQKPARALYVYQGATTEWICQSIIRKP